MTGRWLEKNEPYSLEAVMFGPGSPTNTVEGLPESARNYGKNLG